MRIGVDIMGGDFAPEKTINGAILAAKELPKETKLIFFGQKKKNRSASNKTKHIES